jgi:hypothetical protein
MRLVHGCHAVRSGDLESFAGLSTIKKSAASILAGENTYRKESVKMYGQQRANFDQVSCARPKIVLN